jgi:succinyl-CoA synthetase beta subunit
MKIHEYQARELLQEYGVDVADGILSVSPDEVVQAGDKLGYPIVIKAQVLVGGRGKAGGVKLASDAEDARKKAEEIFGLTIKSYPVAKVFVVPAVEIEQEYYLGITVDRSNKTITLMASAAGGVDIEDLAINRPDEILKVPFDPLKGLEATNLGPALEKVFKEPELIRQAEKTVTGLYNLFIEKGCSLVEINPYALLPGNRLAALDAKINFDDNEIPSHRELEKYKNPEEFNDNERLAQKAGLHFIGLDGEIGCIVNGAGLAMATMDIIKLYGAEPANFLDVGGSSNPEKVLIALKVILSIPEVTGILFNIFGGITRCDDIAKGILMAREQIEIKVPIVIRLIGTNDQEGREMLRKEGIPALENLEEAVKEVIKKAKQL